MLETKSKQKRYWNRIRKRRGSQKPEHTVNGFTVIAFGILLILFVQHTQADSGNSSENGFRDTLEGHDTIHEQMGQEHFAAPDLTEYNGTVTYTTEPKRSAMGLKPVYNLTHKILKTFIFGDPALPSGYLMVVKKDALALGAKSEEDNWQELVSHYWSLLIFIWIMLLLIIGMPFIAVCYLCFCCCRRCTPGCPPCTMQRDICLHMIYSSILLVLVIFIIIFAVIVSLANRVLERGFKETSETLKRGSKDTCSFLQDVSDHIHHLLIFNYEELHAHLMDILNYGDNHILLDVADASQGNALSTLEKILDNMPEARILMRQVNILEKNIRFYGAQMRDGVRGAKRDLYYACHNLIKKEHCRSILYNTELPFVDTSTCLHVDLMPNTTIYLEAMDKIIEDEMPKLLKGGLQRFQEIGAKIKADMEKVTPPLIRDISRAKGLFQAEAIKIRNIIEATLSDIHFRTMNATNSFEDVYERFGKSREFYTALCYVLLMVIGLVLIVALICGCSLNKGTGANWLFFAILLIFCTFSFILMVALIYLMLGIVTFYGACQPMRELEQNGIYRQLDPKIDLSRYIESNEEMQTDTENAPTMRMSSAIKACADNQTIFGLLQKYNLYNLDELEGMHIMKKEDEDSKGKNLFQEDLSKVILLTREEKIKLNDMRNANLSTYHSIRYLENLCKQFTPNLPNIVTEIYKARNVMYNFLYGAGQWNNHTRIGYVSLSLDAHNLATYNTHWTDKLAGLVDNIKLKLIKIDNLILYENRDFKHSIGVLLKAIVSSEEFIKSKGTTFVSSLLRNLTDTVNEQVDNYLHAIVEELRNNIGKCGPIAYIYYRGVDQVCYRLVDPLNALWFGLIPAALLLLPILFVAHRLMCIWKRLHAYSLAAAAILPIGGCPACTGMPYVPPPIITCSGGQQNLCICVDSQKRGGGGGVNFLENVQVDSSDSQITITSASVNSTSKPKKD